MYLICALEPEDHSEAIAEVQKVWPEAEVMHLSLKDLPRFHFPARPPPTAVLLLHRAEGRTLLLDADGYYNAWVVAASSIARGNVFVGIGGLQGAPAPPEALSDPEIVDELVRGGQGSVALVDAQTRLLTWQDGPTPAQLLHLNKTLPPLDLPRSVSDHAAAASRRAAPKGLCQIL